MLQPLDAAAAAGTDVRAVLDGGQGLIEHLVYQARLAAAGDAGDAGEHPERYFDVDILQIVLARAADDEFFPVPLAAPGRHGYAPRAGEVLPGDAARLGDDVLHRALGHHLAAVDARAGADIDDPVRRAHGVLVVLDDDERVAQVAQFLERVDELAVVALVQPDAGLVEDVEHAHQRGADLRGQADALALAAGERGRRAG